MLPGMVTAFLLQCVRIWNSFLFPYIVLADSSAFPLVVGLNSLLERGSVLPLPYMLAIIGAAVAIVPFVASVLSVQRYRRLDLIAGGVNG
jgi:multiple sugar transport system permease protein